MFSPVRTRLSSPAVALAVLLALLSGCAVGPDYVRVPVDPPEVYKEAGPWKVAHPQTVDAHQPWWELYDDPTLTALMLDANRANQTLAAAEAQYRAAQAVAAQAQAAVWPTVGVSAGAGRARTTSGGVARTADAGSLGLSASWQPDLWGGVRRAVEAGNASAEASGDDLAAARLSIQATLAQNYLQLRVVDVQRDLYAATVEAYTRSYKLTQSQYAAGTALRSDVALAQSQLKNAQASGVDLLATRSSLEHAIAILTGRAPARFALPSSKTTVPELLARLPVVPAGLPSQLLERRPDIAAAERRVAVANANIGVARAAFYPALTLSASGGFSGAAFSTLFDTPSRVWSLGASLAQSLFDGGLRGARSDQAVALYDVAVAQYKQTVLTGFQQVEDNLATLRLLDEEGRLIDEAVQASRLAERSVTAQYRAGTANYLAVVTAQTLALTNERSATQLIGRQLAASVSLVVATGGGWQAGQPVLTGAADASTPSLAARADAPDARTLPTTP